MDILAISANEYIESNNCIQVNKTYQCPTLVSTEEEMRSLMALNKPDLLLKYIGPASENFEYNQIYMAIDDD